LFQFQERGVSQGSKQLSGQMLPVVVPKATSDLGWIQIPAISIPIFAIISPLLPWDINVASQPIRHLAPDLKWVRG
jgi:hypothetical protein